MFNKKAKPNSTYHLYVKEFNVPLGSKVDFNMLTQTERNIILTQVTFSNSKRLHRESRSKQQEIDSLLFDSTKFANMLMI